MSGMRHLCVPGAPIVSSDEGMAAGDDEWIDHIAAVGAGREWPWHHYMDPGEGEQKISWRSTTQLLQIAGIDSGQGQRPVRVQLP